MEAYEISKSVSLLDETIENIVQDIKRSSDMFQELSDKDVIQVKAGAKLRNVIPMAMNQCKKGKGYVVVAGQGAAVGKVTSLAEVVRRRMPFKNRSLKLVKTFWFTA